MRCLHRDVDEMIFEILRCYLAQRRKTNWFFRAFLAVLYFITLTSQYYFYLVVRRRLVSFNKARPKNSYLLAQLTCFFFMIVSCQFRYKITIEEALVQLFLIFCFFLNAGIVFDFLLNFSLKYVKSFYKNAYQNLSLVK